MFGKCGSDPRLGDSDWAACLVAVDGGNCPYNFMKLDDDSTACPKPTGTRSQFVNGQSVNIPYKERVCCLITPTFEIKVRSILFPMLIHL